MKIVSSQILTKANEYSPSQGLSQGAQATENEEIRELTDIPYPEREIRMSPMIPSLLN